MNGTGIRSRHVYTNVSLDEKDMTPQERTTLGDLVMHYCFLLLYVPASLILNIRTKSMVQKKPYTRKG